LIKRLAKSAVIGYVLAIAATGLYSVSETHLYSFNRHVVIYVQSIHSGFPFNWLQTSYPLVVSGGACTDIYPCLPLPIPEAGVQVDWAFFGLNLLLYSLLSILLIISYPRVAARLNIRSNRRSNVTDGQVADTLSWHELAVIAASALTFVWQVLYFSGLAGWILFPYGLHIQWAYWYYSHGVYGGIEGTLLVVLPLVGVVAGLVSTWRFITGGAVVASAGAMLLFIPGQFLGMFLVNPEFAMLFVLWTSIMIAGGVLAIRTGILQADSRHRIGLQN
jgi:hypothetical protein